MNKDIKTIKEKHKDFIKQIEKDLIRKDDDFGNARRVEVYLKKIKGKKVKDKKEKEEILRSIISDYDADVAYQDYLDQLDSPRWFLEKTYPIFYEHFKKRFDKFISDWAKAIEMEKFAENYLHDLFVFYCRLVVSEIESEINYKDSISYVEKNGKPTKEPGKVSIVDATFTEAVDTLFELPDMIIESFTNKDSEYQKQFQEKNKERNRFPGNYLEDRKKNSNLPKYKKVAKLIKVIDTKFKHTHGAQKIACEIAGCYQASFSRWLNSKSKDKAGKTNFDKYSTWQAELSAKDRSKFKKEIENFLEK